MSITTRDCSYKSNDIETNCLVENTGVMGNSDNLKRKQNTTYLGTNKIVF